MSTVLSISARRRYGLARVCRIRGVARARVRRWREAANRPEPPRRRPGPEGPMSDAALVAEIRAVLAASPFHGEGCRKVWARLRHRGVRSSKERVRRVRRENRPPDGFLILLTARAPALRGYRPDDAARGEPSVAPSVRATMANGP